MFDWRLKHLLWVRRRKCRALHLVIVGSPYLDHNKFAMDLGGLFFVLVFFIAVPSLVHKYQSINCWQERIAGKIDLEQVERRYYHDPW